MITNRLLGAWVMTNHHFYYMGNKVTQRRNVQEPPELEKETMTNRDIWSVGCIIL